MLFGDSINKVFITGGAGFIGSHATDILIAQGYEVKNRFYEMGTKPSLEEFREYIKNKNN